MTQIQKRQKDLSTNYTNYTNGNRADLCCLRVIRAIRGQVFLFFFVSSIFVICEICRYSFSSLRFLSLFILSSCQNSLRVFLSSRNLRHLRNLRLSLSVSLLVAAGNSLDLASGSGYPYWTNAVMLAQRQAAKGERSAQCSMLNAQCSSARHPSPSRPSEPWHCLAEEGDSAPRQLGQFQ